MEGIGGGNGCDDDEDDDEDDEDDDDDDDIGGSIGVWSDADNETVDCDWDWAEA